MVTTDSTVIFLAGVGFTLQLFRLAIDALSSITRQVILDRYEARQSKMNIPGRSQSRSKKKRTSDVEARSVRASVDASKEKSVDGAGSISVESLVSKTNTVMSETEQSLNYDRFIVLRNALPRVSLLIHAAISVFYVISTVLLVVLPGDVSRAVVQGCVAFATIVSLLMRLIDSQYQRFTTTQRVLYTTSVLCIIVSFSGNVNSDNFASFDLISIVAAISWFIMATMEALIFPFPREKEYREMKKILSKKALVVMLKPYFWPKATNSSSATLNRIRALSTWFMVASSKLCSIWSPLLLGKASNALINFDYHESSRYVLAYACVQFLSTLFKEGQSLLYLKVGHAAFVQLAEVSFTHLHSLSLDWHLQKKLGEVVRSMDRGISACDNVMRTLFMTLLPALAETISVCVIFALYFDYYYLAVCVFFFIFAYLFTTAILTMWRRKFRKLMVDSDNDWHDICTDSLVNFETVKFFTAEKYEIERFSNAIEKYQDGNVKLLASMSALNLTQTFLVQACLGASLVLAINGIREKYICCMANGCEGLEVLVSCCTDLGVECSGLNVGDFVAVLAYVTNIFAPLDKLRAIYNQLVMAVVDLTNLSELLAETPDVHDIDDAQDLPLRNPDDNDDVVVEFKNVKFHYPSQSKRRGLKGVSFQMKRGTTTAIVGTTGAGKTTISRLLFRFYDVLDGCIKVNGMDIRDATQQSLRSMIGVVPQDGILFNDSIEANIKYGKMTAPFENTQEVAKNAELYEFIMSLPDRWKTLVGDRGMKLSGGEKQRTAIARCLLKDPPIVVLDEATSSLDTLTESSVQKSLERLGEDRTVLVIAHRLGTIRNADQIIVLKNGIVAEQGTHDELLGVKNGTYSKMWEKQLHHSSSKPPSL